MKRIIAIVFFVISATFNAISQSMVLRGEPPVSSITQEDMIQWMDSLTTFWMDSVDIPGMVVSIVAGDSIVMQKGYGHINQEETAEVNPSQSPFRIASISKTFTALAAIQLVSEGKLDLNQDVSRYLDFEIDRYKNSDIKLHNLLTHSAGLDERLLGGGTRDREEVVQLKSFLSTYMPAQVREPGVTFSYSNTGYALAGYLCEVASETPFHQYVQDLIFNPLGMDRTTYWRGDDPIYKESKSYFLDDNGFREYPPYEIRRYPSGSLISTADDVAAYMIMILNNGNYNGRQIVSPDVIDQFTKPVFTQDPGLEGTRSYGFFNWNINGINYLSHGGSIEGYRSMLYLFPEQKVGLFLSANSSWGGLVNSRIGSAFRKKMVGIHTSR